MENKSSVRVVNDEIRLIPYYRNDAVSLPWYQDAELCKQVDNRDTPYDVELLQRMFRALGFEQTAAEWYAYQL